MKDKIIDGVINMVDKIFTPIRNLMRDMVYATKVFLNSVIDKANKLLPKKFEIPKFDLLPEVSKEQKLREQEDEQKAPPESILPLSTGIDEDQRKHTGDIKTAKDFLKEAKSSDFFNKELYGDSIIDRGMVDEVPTKHIKAVLDLEKDDLSPEDINFLENELEKRRFDKLKSIGVLPNVIVPEHITKGATLNADSAAYATAGSSNPKINIISKNQGDTIAATKNITINEEKPVGADTSHLSSTFFRKRAGIR